MAVILNIDTSTNVCSVALTADGMIIYHLEDFSGQNHATLLSDFIYNTLSVAEQKELSLDAVAVGIGPGSYTGLRIGLSEAKGLAFSMDIPLIGIPTLKTMAVSAMFKYDLSTDAILVPMIDARRMEVYAAVYDFSLNEVSTPSPMIIDDNSLSEYNDKEIYIFGDGSDKAKEILYRNNIIHLDGIRPIAVDMLALSEKAYRDNDFIDLAYSTPMYLKEYQATKPKNPLLNLNKN